MLNDAKIFSWEYKIQILKVSTFNCFLMVAEMQKLLMKIVVKCSITYYIFYKMRWIMEELSEGFI